MRLALYSKLSRASSSDRNANVGYQDDQLDGTVSGFRRTDQRTPKGVYRTGEGPIYDSGLFRCNPPRGNTMEGIDL